MIDIFKYVALFLKIYVEISEAMRYFNRMLSTENLHVKKEELRVLSTFLFAFHTELK